MFLRLLFKDVRFKLHFKCSGRLFQSLGALTEKA